MIDLRNQFVSEELASSDSDAEDSNRWELGSEGDKVGGNPTRKEC